MSMFRWLIAGAAAAYVVYRLIVGSDSDSDDAPLPRHQPPPYYPQPPVRQFSRPSRTYEQVSPRPPARDARPSSRPSQTYEQVSPQLPVCQCDECQSSRPSQTYERVSLRPPVRQYDKYQPNRPSQTYERVSPSLPVRQSSRPSQTYERVSPRLPAHSYYERQPSRPSQTHEQVSRQQQAGRGDECQDQADEAPTIEPESPESLRARAKQENQLMSQYYDQSKDAYERRDHALAKVHSEQGKRHALKRDQLNEQASTLIFKENNKENDPYTVDLHGLYVKEAIAYSEKAVSRAIRECVSEVRLIVGQGNHSDGGVAKLKPALQEDMKARGFLAEVDPRNTGVLVVQMNNSRFDSLGL